MEPIRTRQEVYRQFLEFVGTDIQSERRAVNRRMFSVLLWCFILPALLSSILLVLIRLGIVPRSVRSYLDWLILIFPVMYSLYFLSFEVLRELPALFRRGGVVNNLAQSIREGEWRERVCDAMERAFTVDGDNWKWVLESFRLDLERMQHRTRYLTALAGAVFFLLLQGLDSIGDDPTAATSLVINHPKLGPIQIGANDWTQFAGLGLFLVLFYLSGNQNYHALVRYLNCANLLQFRRRPPR